MIMGIVNNILTILKADSMAANARAGRILPIGSIKRYCLMLRRLRNGPIYRQIFRKIQIKEVLL